MAVPPTSPSRSELRSVARAARAAFVASLDESTRRRLTAGLAVRLAPLLVGRQRIAGYAAMRDEIDPASTNFTLWPRVVGDDRPLAFHAVAAAELVAAPGWGPREPNGDAPVAIPDAVLVPLLAADLRGYRLGYGKGHYDRTLHGLDALRVGVAWDCQIVEHVPDEAWDEPLDWLVTPTRTIRCNGGRCDRTGVGAQALVG